MQKNDVVFWFFLPADQDATKVVHPTMSAFYHPTPRPLTSLPGQFLGFFAPRLNMPRKSKFGQKIVDFLIIVILIQSHALRLLVWFCSSLFSRPQLYHRLFRSI